MAVVRPTASSPSVSEPFCGINAEGVQKQWFKKEVHVHEGQLKAYLRGCFPSVRDVEDVVQESYLRIWRRQAEKPIESAKTFLFAIARRLAIDWIRHEKVTAIDTVDNLDTLAVYDNGNSVADAASRAETIKILIDAIDSLPARSREIMILRKFKFLSSRETAEQLGIQECTVNMQLMRANARVREYLAARGITNTLGRDP